MAAMMYLRFPHSHRDVEGRLRSFIAAMQIIVNLWQKNH